MKHLRPTILAMAIVTIAAFSRCKKDEITSPDAVFKIRTHSYPSLVHGGDIMLTYTYDSVGRVNRVVTTGAAGYVTTYSYSGDSVVVTGSPQAHAITYALNAEGYAASAVYRDSAGTAIGTSQYVYDSEGHLISDGLATYKWVEGNRTKQILGADTVSYTFLADQINTVGRDQRGITFLGKDSRNLVSAIEIDGNTTTFTYEYDNAGRVSRVNGFVEESYTYY